MIPADLRERVQRFETGRNDDSDTYYRAATDRTVLLAALDQVEPARKAALREAVEALPDCSMSASAEGTPHRLEGMISRQAVLALLDDLA